MTQMEYDKLDYYERLRTLIVVAAETKRGLESIVSKYDAWDYIMRLLDNLESYLPLFSQDIEFNSIELLSREFKDMKEIIPVVFNQMIAFVQSAEVERFADRFYDNTDSQYLTVVASKGTGEITVHKGIDFFDSYQRQHKGDEI